VIGQTAPGWAAGSAQLPATGEAGCCRQDVPCRAPPKAPHIRESGVKLSSRPEKTARLQFRNRLEPRHSPDTLRNCPGLCRESTMGWGLGGPRGGSQPVPLPSSSPRGEGTGPRVGCRPCGQPDCTRLELLCAGCGERGPSGPGSGRVGDIFASSSPLCLDFPQSFS